MRSAWVALAEMLKDLNSSARKLLPDSYTLPFPATLSGPISVKNRTFVTDFPCPSTFDPVSLSAKAGFVRLLAEELKSSLSAGFDLAVVRARMLEAGRKAETQDSFAENAPHPHSAVFGSSQMHRNKGYQVKDRTKKSWVLGEKTERVARSSVSG